ncbi:hypothetical protein HZS_4733 [Henneguya salminicola]|nr:hypothetical protein HZS_4733 [Henneguya salminicola]
MENDEELHSISSANSETKQDEEQEEDVNDKTNGLFADIFGESDEEDKFLEVFFCIRLKGSITQTEKVLPNEQFTSGQHFVSDFDMMMIQKKASSHRRQRKKDLDFQTEQDNKAAEIVQKMFNAVRSDRQKVEAGELAVEKLQLCTYLKTQLNRSGLYESFVENNVHHAIAEWLSILPDGSLPNIKIRETLLSILENVVYLLNLKWTYPTASILKSSQLGRCLKTLSKHPKETPKNRHNASKLIFNWMRPIYGVVTNFSDLSREEREVEHQRHSNKIKPSQQNIKILANPQKSVTPQNVQMARARIPQPSLTNYINRPPKSNIVEAANSGTREKLIRMKQTKIFQKKVRKSKN